MQQKIFLDRVRSKEMLLTMAVLSFAVGFFPHYAHAASTSTKTYYLISGSSFIVPIDWNNASNTIEAIGGGGGGGYGGPGMAGGGGGGGGGAYAKASGIALTPSTTIAYRIGGGGGTGGGGGDTFLCSSLLNCTSIAAATVKIGAKGGGGGSSTGSRGGGGGGSALASVGDIKYSGGGGGKGGGAGSFGNGAWGGGGGGGAAGPHGSGKNGGGDPGKQSQGGGGGGGADGGGGGANAGNYGGGVGGSGGSYGGSGGTGATCCTNGNAGSGGPGKEWDSTHGAGGGGGGGADNNYDGSGKGGTYGGGGGGAGDDSNGAGGGASGIIVIKYEPAPLIDCQIAGNTVSGGGSHVFYSQSSVPYGQSCDAYSQTRTCMAGALTGNDSYSEWSCAAKPGKSCMVGNTTVPDGVSSVFYNTATVPPGESCDSASHSQSRTCTDGTLSGGASYVYGSCGIVSQSTLALSASATLVRQGSSVALSWNGGNSTSCTVSGTNGFSSSGVVGTNISTGAINQRSVFTLMCSFGTSSKQASVSVSIIPVTKED